MGQPSSSTCFWNVGMMPMQVAAAATARSPIIIKVPFFPDLLVKNLRFSSSPKNRSHLTGSGFWKEVWRYDESEIG